MIPEPLQGRIHVGTAGWSIPKPHAAEFPVIGTHLQRYATRLPAAEINSSFYRSHKPETYARWATSVPEGFRFAVKIPREITHIRRLVDCDDLLHQFLSETRSLGQALGPLLLQLPPSLAFDPATASPFLHGLRSHFEGHLVCEPRHPSWFSAQTDTILSQLQIARVAADPAPVPQAAEPGGWPGIVYRRLHGSPRIYYSAYPPELLDTIAGHIHTSAASGAVNWCILDNTAIHHATHDALDLLRRLSGG